MNQNVYFLISYNVLHPNFKFCGQQILELEGFNNLNGKDRATLLKEEIDSFKIINYPENVVEISNIFQLN